MAQRQLCRHGVLDRALLAHPLRISQLSRNYGSKIDTLAASPEGTSQVGGDEPHLSVVKDLRVHFSKAGIMPSVGILDTLRSRYPNHTVTQTPKSTGLLKFAKAGQAYAKLDTNTDFYASRKYKIDDESANSNGRLKDKVQFGRYDYRWGERDFHLYVADYWESAYQQVQNHYIVYPRNEADLIGGQSQVVDKLITAAAKHLNNVDDQILVYDRGYWKKSRKLWENVQACDWEKVILNREMKRQLIGDIEGFFDRKEDYESFAVPWKVCSLDICHS